MVRAAFGALVLGLATGAAACEDDDSSGGGSGGTAASGGFTTGGSGGGVGISRDQYQGVMLSSFFRVGMQVTDGVVGSEAAHAAMLDYYENHSGDGGNVNDWLQIATVANPDDDHQAGCTDPCDHSQAAEVADRAWGDFMWQRHPWALYDEADPGRTAPGVEYLLAYWLGRYHGYCALVSCQRIS